MVVIVSVDDPEPLIVAGLKPALVMPLGNPDSLSTLRLTGPLNPLTGFTVTVYVAEPPGNTSLAASVTEIEKFGELGLTVIVRVGGLGSELPFASMTVNDAR